MSDKPETTDAVIDAMRRYADIVELGPPPIGKAFADLFREYANRFEAAAELERTAHVNDIHDALYKATGIPGNAAALRAALEKAHNNIKKAREFIAWQTREDELLMEAQQEIKTALAAPARNCDMGTAEEAFKAWESDNKKPPEQCFLQWLFAPAKGGDHA